MANKKITDGEMVNSSVVVDGTNLIAGRMSSHVAKLLLKGKKVSIINCEKIVISGNKKSIIREYKDFLKVSSIINPKHGPFHPRSPDTIIRRMVRGMLPKNKTSGRDALRRLRTYIGTPEEAKKLNKIILDKVGIIRSATQYTSMKELGKTIGWSNE